MEYDAKVHIRSKLHYFELIKGRLSENRRTLFRSTCFGPWLDLKYFVNEESLIHYMLQKQFPSDDDHYDLALLYFVNGHQLHFGRREFHLITGFKFGLPSFRKFRSGDIIFRDRVFPNKVGENLKAIDLLGLIEDEELFGKLSDEDAVRVCLILSLIVIFMGHGLLTVVADVFLRLVENLEAWNDFPWGEHIWRQLYEALRNRCTRKNVEYTLDGFVFCFMIWILESSTQSRLWWSKDVDVIPRALSWSRKVPFQAWEDFGMLFPQGKDTNHDLYPTRSEADSEWYTKGIRFFNWYSPRPAPVVHGGLFEDYMRKRAELRAKAHDMDNEAQSPKSRDTLEDRVRTLQGICNCLLMLPAEVNSLKARVHKLETIIQYMKRKMMGGHRQDRVDQKGNKGLEKDEVAGDEKDIDLGDEFCPNLNHNFLELFEFEVQNEDVEAEGVGENECVYQATQDRVKAQKQQAEVRCVAAQREKRARDLKDRQKGAKLKKQFLKTTYVKLPVQNKRQYELVPREEFTDVDTDVKVPPLDELKRRNSSLSPYKLKKCKDLTPWEEDLIRPNFRIDKVHVNRELEAYLQSSYKSRCQFPWCNDITVDYLFWDSFVGMDDTREGWFRDEHIELWVMYLWHFRPSFADWSVVSSYFLTLLLQGSLPLCYATDEVYKLAWSDVDRVFIPINEPKKHWSVAQFHIQSGNVIFYDSLYPGEEEGRDWYLQMRSCLEVNLPLILRETGVFAKKRIDPNSYKIKFRLAKNVPKQGGVFGDCGVFVCMFLYRFAYGIPLDVDDPTQAALAYREGLIRYYFKNRIICG